MITERRVFWLIMIGLLIGLIYVLDDILTPFVLCAVFSYMLDPLVDALEKRGWSRTSGTLLVWGVAMMLLLLTIFLLVPIVAGQVVSLLRTVVNVLTNMETFVDKLLSEFSAVLEFLGIDSAAAVQAELTAQLGEQLTSFGLGLFDNTSGMFDMLANQITTVGSSVSMLLLFPVISFYMLRDWDRMRHALLEIMPRSSVSALHTLGHRCNLALGGFFRGQLLVMLLLAIFYGISLTLIGLPYGFTIGSLAGILSFIPYIGAISGFLVGIVVSAISFGDWWHVLMVVVVFGFGQTLESVWLTPKLIGDSINVHPVWLIFGLLAGGSLFGFVGLLLAIPIVAVTSVLVRFSIEQYQDSHLFDDAT